MNNYGALREKSLPIVKLSLFHRQPTDCSIWEPLVRESPSKDEISKVLRIVEKYIILYVYKIIDMRLDRIDSSKV